MVHFIVLATLTLSSAVASTKPVEWHADYGKALAATKADDRPLLIVLDIPGDAKAAVEDKQLETKGKQAELLANYQLCHVDVSTEYGKRVAKAFKAKKFPFTAIIDKTGSIVLHKKQGPLSESEWSETLAAYKKGDRSLAKRYTSAYRGSGFSGANSYNSSTSPNFFDPSYCPSCQRNSQQNF